MNVDRRGRYVGFYEDSKHPEDVGNDKWREAYHNCRPKGFSGLVEARSKFVGGRCEVCGQIGHGVHHVSGKSIRWGNIIVVCRACHSRIHNGE